MKIKLTKQIRKDLNNKGYNIPEHDINKYLWERKTPDDDIIKKFGNILFGDFRKKGEKDTDYEKEIFQTIRDWIKGDFMGKSPKRAINTIVNELSRLKNEYPAYAPARVALGILYYGNGNIIEAQTEWEHVLGREPQNSEASMYLNISRTATETTLTI